MSVLLVVTALLGVALTAGSLWGLTNAHPYRGLAVMPLFAGIVLIGYSAWFGRRLWLERNTSYELVLGPSQVELYVQQPNGKRLFAKMAIGEIDYVEYYTPRDRESFVFHGKNGRIIEAPLWSMDGNAQSGLGLLRTWDLKIIVV